MTEEEMKHWMETHREFVSVALEEKNNRIKELEAIVEHLKALVKKYQYN